MNCDYCTYSDEELYAFKESIPAGSIIPVCNVCLNRIVGFQRKTIDTDICGLDYEKEYHKLLQEHENLRHAHEGLKKAFGNVMKYW